jgi:hypothetical protein
MGSSTSSVGMAYRAFGGTTSMPPEEVPAATRYLSLHLQWEVVLRADKLLRVEEAQWLT